MRRLLEGIEDWSDSSRELLSHMMDSIVNPKCDECHRAIHSAKGMGPHLCFECRASLSREQAHLDREFRAAEGKRRTVHRVKLPEGMKR